MKRRLTKPKLVFLFLVTVGSLLWIFRPYPTTDLTQVHPQLLLLERPYKSIDTDYYMDGGTTTVELVDNKDHVFFLCFPNSMLDEEKHLRDKIFIGAQHYHDEGSILLVGYEHTKYYLLELLLEKKDRTIIDDRAIAKITGRIRNWARVAYGTLVMLRGGDDPPLLLVFNYSSLTTL